MTAALSHSLQSLSIPSGLCTLRVVPTIITTSNGVHFLVGFVANRAAIAVGVIRLAIDANNALILQHGIVAEPASRRDTFRIARVAILKLVSVAEVCRVKVDLADLAIEALEVKLGSVLQPHMPRA